MTNPTVPESQSETAVSEESFAELMVRLREGSEEAAWTIVDRFTPYVLKAIRRSLPRKIRSKVDSIDLVNTLFGSLLINRDRMARIQEPGQLISLLRKAANARVVEEYRRYTICAARNVDVESGTLEEQTDTGSAVAGDGRCGGREPTPSQVAIGREKWGLLLSSLSRKHRQIVMLRFKGETYDKIAQQVDGVSASEAHRIITSVTAKLLE